METAIVLIAVLAAAGACPLTALMQRRRGRAASCCSGPRERNGQLAPPPADPERVGARVAALERGEEGDR